MRAIVSLVFCLTLVPQAAIAAATGEWLVASKTAHIRIVDCEGTLWGVVSWQQRPGGVDSKNPDPAKRARPTLGMPVLLGMKASGPNRWGGSLYNSQNGKTYTGVITLLDPDRVRVRGCVLAILCGGEDWTRVKQSDEDDASGAAICMGLNRSSS